MILFEEEDAEVFMAYTERALTEAEVKSMEECLRIFRKSLNRLHIEEGKGLVLSDT